MRGRGGFLGFDRDTDNREFSGVWRIGDVFSLVKDGKWSSSPLTWDYNPMGNFSTQTGSWTNSSTVIAQNGASYTTQGRAISDAGQKALQGNWNLDWQLNRYQSNSSPFPGWHTMLTRGSLSDIQSNRTNKALVAIYFGNAESTQFYVYDGNGTTLFSSGDISSTTAEASAGTAWRISYDSGSGVFTAFVNTSGSFTSMTQKSTYTLSAAEKSNLETNYLTTDWYIGIAGRGGTDGNRNMAWVAS